MSRLVVRHGLSEANNRESYGKPAFGNPDAPLMPIGRVQAIALGEQLTHGYGIDIVNEAVAVSKMRRSQETATTAGFRLLSVYPELNEEKGNLSDEEISTAIHTQNPPEATVKAAKFLIEHPPQEKVWITHALLIATMCQELGVYGDVRFIPRFCEIRELPL